MVRVSFDSLEKVIVSSDVNRSIWRGHIVPCRGIESRLCFTRKYGFAIAHSDCVPGYK